jgi:hypothetical protein
MFLDRQVLADGRAYVPEGEPVMAVVLVDVVDVVDVVVGAAVPAGGTVDGGVGEG